MTGPDPVFSEKERSKHPAAFDRFFQVRRKVGNRGSTPGQFVESSREIRGQSGGIHTQMLDDPVQIRVSQLKDWLSQCTSSTYGLPRILQKIVALSTAL